MMAHFPQGVLEQKEYDEVIEREVLPQGHKWFSDIDHVFTHNGTPCHRNRNTSKLLAAIGVQTLPWNANLTDFNAIEDVLKYWRR